MSTRGSMSPPSPVTLPSRERDLLGIPRTATHFAWAYPPSTPHGFDGISSELRRASLTSPGLRFCLLGGYMYFSMRRVDDAGVNLEAVLAIRVTSALGSQTARGLLKFCAPVPWPASATKALLSAGRFQEVTLPSLRQKGARWYAWIRPDEIVDPSAPPPAHGAFAYLFDSHLKPNERDRYFAVSADAPLPDTEEDDAVVMSPQGRAVSPRPSGGGSGWKFDGADADAVILPALQTAFASELATGVLDTSVVLHYLSAAAALSSRLTDVSPTTVVCRIASYRRETEEMLHATLTPGWTFERRSPPTELTEAEETDMAESGDAAAYALGEFWKRLAEDCDSATSGRGDVHHAFLER
eukprot:Hpha_TRINITY_DN9133_c0_g1::TRINITY_DN9133_c0_g1_i2::g.94511::m.94511